MSDFVIFRVDESSQFPEWLPPGLLATFLHKALMPFEDPVQEIISGIEYAMSKEPGMGGFILVALDGHDPIGAVVVLKTGMKGYVPPYMILYVAVDPEHRGKMIGHKLMMNAIKMCEGNIKLHVEHDNHAKKYYEAIGFQSKYAEMRLKK